MNQTVTGLRPYSPAPIQGGPLVSTIIRTKDRPELLREALSSIAEQTYPYVEAIVINDGGCDVGQITQSFAGPIRDVRYFCLGENIGRSAAANLGLREANGTYVIFLDDDDWFLPNHIAKLVNALQTDTQVGVAYTGVECLRENETGQWARVHIFDSPFDPIRLLIENYVPMHAALFRRDLVASGCYLDESLEIYEDWDFWVQLAQKTSFRYVKGISAIYRIGGTGGFGVAGDELLVQVARKAFLNKWRNQWSSEALLKIVEHAKHGILQPELLKELKIQEHNAQAFLAELESTRRNLDETARALDQAGEILEKTREELDATHRERARIQKEKEQSISVLTTQLELANRSIELWSGRCKELESSHSWRLTKPLRAVSTGARQLLGTIRAQSQPPDEGAASATHEDAAAGSSEGTESTSRSTAGSESGAFPIPQVELSWQPLHFRPSVRPQISIIIPVHNKHLYTFTCLKSLAADTVSLAHEIIVIDDGSDDETPAMLAEMDGVRGIVNEDARGFVNACNYGARQAIGKYLVFLNNDTIVRSGWLNVLVDTFEKHPDTGLVGVRLIYPDGRLQEAGGIIWQDGSGWNYGRGDDPDKPQYNYLREADYCSGACLAIPRQLFNDLGAFSPEFAPAYYEDTDLAFKVRAAGKKVIYQPAVTVVHFEGVTSGTDISSGFKRFQAVNRDKFVRKWKSDLRGPYISESQPDLEKDHGVSIRALVIDSEMLKPDQDSGSLRMMRLLAVFQNLGFKVSFISSTMEYQQPYVGQLQQQGVEVIYAPFVPSVDVYLQTNGQQFDVILVSRADIMERYLEIVRSCSPSALLIFDTVDLHYLREQRLAALTDSADLAESAAARKRQELGLMEKSDVTLVVSPVEKDLVSTDRPDLAVEVISNIHEIQDSGIAFEQREGILFVGGFNHPPNVDAVRFYLDEVLHLVQQELEDVKTYVVGSKPTEEIRSRASASVIVTGHVPDIAAYLNRCRVSIAPLRYGAGIKGKINMSMACGVPVVATSVAAEGMSLTDGKDVLIGDDAAAFANAVVRLYRDRALWEMLVENGRTNIEQHFSRDVATKAMREILASHGVLESAPTNDEIDAAQDAWRQ